MSWRLPKVWRLTMSRGCAAECFVVLNPRFPNRHANLANRDKFHHQRICKRLPWLRTDTFFQTRRQKRLLLRFDFATDRSRFITGESQFVSHIAWFNFFNHERCLTKLFAVSRDRRATGRARDFHTAVGKNKMDGVFVLSIDVVLLLFVRPTI